MGVALYRDSQTADNTTAVAVRWGEGEESHETPEPVFAVLDER
jgi:hypothetical protein